MSRRDRQIPLGRLIRRQPAMPATIAGSDRQRTARPSDLTPHSLWLDRCDAGRLASSVIVHAPVRDLAAFGRLVADCQRRQVRLIAVVGDDQVGIEHEIDQHIIATQPYRCIATTSHPDKRDALKLIRSSRSGRRKRGRARSWCEVRL